MDVKYANINVKNTGCVKIIYTDPPAHLNTEGSRLSAITAVYPIRLHRSLLHSTIHFV